jgi:hypothetical protein
VPKETSVTFDPLTVHTDALFEEKEIGSPELLVAVSATGPVPSP